MCIDSFISYHLSLSSDKDTLQYQEVFLNCLYRVVTNSRSEGFLILLVREWKNLQLQILRMQFHFREENTDKAHKDKDKSQKIELVEEREICILAKPNAKYLSPLKTTL